MGLRDLRTDLKSLRYSGDTLGGGTSNQPYIKTPIPDGFNNLQNATSDFILRGGILAARDSLTDVRRLGKMFVDTKSPNGVLFIAKQNLLSRISVRTQASTGPLNDGVYTPLSTLAQAGLVAFGGHLNKQGLNPFANTGYNGNFQGSYLRALKDATNATSEYANKYDRLVQLFGIKIVPKASSQFLAYPYADKNIIFSGTTNILKYSGGPGAPLGIGNTTIKYALNNSGSPLTTIYDNFKTNPNNSIVNYITTNTNGFVSFFTDKNSPNSGTAGIILNQQNYSFNNNERNVSNYTPFIGKDFRKDLIKIISTNAAPPSSTILSKSPDYVTKNIEARLNYGGKNNFGPGNSFGKNLLSYTNGSGIGPVDKLNALSLYRSENVEQNSNAYPTNDLVKFRIASIDSNNPSFKTFMHFRAFINSFSDNYNGAWNPITYLGRGENFYTYSNFTRTISLSWTVAAQSKEELIPMYKKLNYLASNVAPDYTSNGYMTGNLVQLTIGGYLYEQVGFITSLTYDIPEDSPWEIGIDDVGNNDSSVKELPHRINVSTFSFTPIHDFIPSKQNLSFEGADKNNNPTGKADGYGDQRFIALNDGGGNNNYDILRKTYE